MYINSKAVTGLLCYPEITGIPIKLFLIPKWKYKLRLFIVLMWFYQIKRPVITVMYFTFF